MYEADERRPMEVTGVRRRHYRCASPAKRDTVSFP